MRVLALVVLLAVVSSGCSIIETPQRLNDLMSSYTELSGKVQAGFEKLEDAVPSGALEAFKEASDSTVAAIEGYGDVVGNVSEYLGKLQEGDNEVVTATVGGALNMLGTAIGVPNMGSVLVAGVLGAGGGAVGSVPLVNRVGDRKRKKSGEPTGLEGEQQPS